MTLDAPGHIYVFIHPDCNNLVAYQNIPVHRKDIDRADGSALRSVKYVREDLSAKGAGDVEKAFRAGWSEGLEWSAGAGTTEPWEAETAAWERNRAALASVSQGGETQPIFTKNVEAGFAECVMEDAPVVVEEFGYGFAILKHLDTRKPIGIRWPLAPSPRVDDADVARVVKQLRAHSTRGSVPAYSAMIAAANLIEQQAARITELEAQLAALREGKGWQPIETAPDNQVVLVYIPNDIFCDLRQMTGQIDAAFYWPHPENDRPGWFTPSGEPYADRSDVTHWQPRPEPPAAKGTGNV